jgi:hypothetical protein
MRSRFIGIQFVQQNPEASHIILFVDRGPVWSTRRKHLIVCLFLWLLAGWHCSSDQVMDVRQ